MKRIMGLISAGLLAACSPSDSANKNPPAANAPVAQPAEIAQPDTPAEAPPPIPAYYQTGWAVTGGWPGEYPQGFSILEDGVTVMGRPDMNPQEAASITCPLPKYATYQPWNFARNENDALLFMVATRIFSITVTKPSEIEAIASQQSTGDLVVKAETLKLEPGETLLYKRYIGEGYAVLERGGVDYEINIGDLNDVTDIETAAQGDEGSEDLWVRVTCDGASGQRTWLLYNDVIQHPDIAVSPIAGYGEASDLNDKSGAEARRLKNMALEVQPIEDQ